MYSINNNYSDNTENSFKMKFTVCLRMELINFRLNKNKTTKEFYLPVLKDLFKKSYSITKK